MDFEKGDVVTLRSGGPAMTVRKVGMENLGSRPIWCVWMTKGKKLDAAFDAQALEKPSEIATAN
jgi:uncharacterized protein YodC (DUF2158 family)